MEKQSPIRYITTILMNSGLGSQSPRVYLHVHVHVDIYNNIMNSDNNSG